MAYPIKTPKAKEQIKNKYTRKPCDKMPIRNQILKQRIRKKGWRILEYSPYGFEFEKKILKKDKLLRVFGFWGKENGKERWDIVTSNIYGFPPKRVSWTQRKRFKKREDAIKYAFNYLK